MSAMETELARLRALGAVEPPPVDEAALAARYERVRACIEAETHADALEDAFALVHAKPWERAYQLALALCLQHLQAYESAGEFYALALVLDATDALCAFRIGECLQALDQLPDAREAFETAVKLSWLDPAYAEVRELAQERLDELGS